MIRVRIETALKRKAEAVLGRLGITPTEAITFYYRQIALNRGLPSPVRKPSAATRKALRDADNGKLREWTDIKSLQKSFE